MDQDKKNEAVPNDSLLMVGVKVVQKHNITPSSGSVILVNTCTR